MPYLYKYKQNKYQKKIKCPDLMKGALTTELPKQPQWSESNISYKGVDLSDDEQFVRNMPC